MEFDDSVFSVSRHKPWLPVKMSLSTLIRQVSDLWPCRPSLCQLLSLYKLFESSSRCRIPILVFRWLFLSQIITFLSGLWVVFVLSSASLSFIKEKWKCIRTLLSSFALHPWLGQRIFKISKHYHKSCWLLFYRHL